MAELLNHELVNILRTVYKANHHNCKGGGLGFGLLHYALIRNLRPSNILCVGSTRGFIPACCALACKDVGAGKVDFVDADDGSWGGSGIWKTAGRDHWKPLGVEDWINLHVCRIEDFEAGRYQYIYYDADHSYFGTKQHFELLWPHLDAGGIFAFHDVTTDRVCPSGKFGAMQFWQELEGEKLTIERSSGLGIMRKI